MYVLYVCMHVSFVLVLGRNPESFRIYEAVEAGSIPILALDKEYESHSCKNAYLPFIKYNAPFVFLKDWKQLPKTLSMYLENPEKVAHLQRRLKPWYMQFFANISKQLDNAAGEDESTFNVVTLLILYKWWWY